MSERIQNFKDLDVWKKAHQLAKEIFLLTDAFPKSYQFNVTSQLRRAALSVPTNLAEGSAAAHSKELIQFVGISKRSVSEVQYLLLFAQEQGLLTLEQYRVLSDRYEEVDRMLGGLRRSLNRRTGLTRHSALTTRH